MDNRNGQNEFRFTYSAKEQEEIKRIREKYDPPTENKMEQLRRLDRGVTQKAQTVSLCFGIIGVLILGFGMSLIMTEIGKLFGITGTATILSGIPIGIIGGSLVCLAYPIYGLILKRERKKLAPTILRLTDELMK